MSNDNGENEEEQPLDPEMEKVRQKLVRLLAVSIGIMVIGLLAVVGAVIFKVGNEAEQTQAANPGESMSEVPAGISYEGIVDLPDGAKITNASLSGNHLLLTVQLSDEAQELWLYDLKSARIFGRISVK